MSIPVTVSHEGALLGSPAASSVGTPSLSELLRTSFTATYSSEKGGRPSIVGATSGSPFTIPFETITKARLLALRVRSGHVVVRYTSPNGGSAQLMPVADLLLLHNPFAGDELTAIDIIGTADIEYVLAGDTT